MIETFLVTPVCIGAVIILATILYVITKDNWDDEPL